MNQLFSIARLEKIRKITLFEEKCSEKFGRLKCFAYYWVENNRTSVLFCLNVMELWKIRQIKKT